jgi:hypothetical protein
MFGHLSVKLEGIVRHFKYFGKKTRKSAVARPVLNALALPLVSTLPVLGTPSPAWRSGRGLKLSYPHQIGGQVGNNPTFTNLASRYDSYSYQPRSQVGNFNNPTLTSLAARWGTILLTPA